MWQSFLSVSSYFVVSSWKVLTCFFFYTRDSARKHYKHCLSKCKTFTISTCWEWLGSRLVRFFITNKVHSWFCRQIKVHLMWKERYVFWWFGTVKSYVLCLCNFFLMTDLYLVKFSLHIFSHRRTSKNQNLVRSKRAKYQSLRQRNGKGPH